MATIVPPSAPSAPFYAAKSIMGANGTQIDIFGYTIPNSLNLSSLTAPYSFPNQTTLFDVSSLTADHEVIVIGYVSPSSTSSSTTYTATWYRDRDGSIIFQKSVSIGASGSGATVAFWIGWLSENPAVGTYPQYREIQENGNYHVVLSASGGETFSQTINFAVIGIPANTAVINPTTDGGEWTVRTSDYFDSSNYIEAGVSFGSVTDGQSYPPSSIIDSISAPSSNSGAAASGNITTLNVNTPYTVYGYVQAANGLYYSAGSTTFHTLNARPNNFYWAYSYISSGANAIVDHRDWNNLASSIDNFRAYEGFMAPFGFTTASSGQNIEAYMYNQLLNASYQIDGNMLNNVLPPAIFYTGDDFYASYLNDIVTSLNSIP